MKMKIKHTLFIDTKKKLIFKRTTDEKELKILINALKKYLTKKYGKETYAKIDIDMLINFDPKTLQ